MFVKYYFNFILTASVCLVPVGQKLDFAVVVLHHNGIIFFVFFSDEVLIKIANYIRRYAEFNGM